MELVVNIVGLNITFDTRTTFEMKKLRFIRRIPAQSYDKTQLIDKLNDTRNMFKVTIKTAAKKVIWSRSGVFVANFKHIYLMIKCL